jgi:hypothetical protein
MSPRSAHADHGAPPEQVVGDVRIIQVHAPAPDPLDQVGGQRVGVDLQPQVQRLHRGEGRHRLVDLQLPGPEVFVAESVEAKDLSSLGQQLARVARDGVVEVGR